jgi:hypothetical protein
MRYEEVKRKTEDADDLSKLTLAKQEAAAARTLANKQAKVENWTPEQLQARHDEIIRDFMGASEGFTARNRQEMTEAMSRQASSWLATSDLDATILRSEQASERMDAAIDLAFMNKNWDEYSRLNEVSYEGEMSSEAEYTQRKRNMDAAIKADELIEQYKVARQEGNEDAFLMSLSEQELTPETVKIFNSEKSQYDSLTKQVETELKTERAIAIANTTQEITASTTDEYLIQRFQQLKLTDYGILSTWYKARERQQKANEVINATELDPFNKADRKALNSFVESAAQDTQGRFDIAMGLAVDSRIAPQWLDTYFNKGALNNIQESGENWIRYQQASDGVPLGVDADAVERFEYYADLRAGGAMDSQEAAQTVNAYYDGMNNERIRANRDAWSDKRYGDGNTAPVDMIEERVAELLQESDEPTLAVQNMFLPDKVPEYPAELRRFIDRVSQSSYGNTANVESTANTVFRLLKQSGWQVTTVNDGVDSGEQTIDAQWMAKPPSRSKDVTRLQLATDLAGQTFFVNGQLQEIDADNVEIYTHTIAPDGTDAWRLRVNGDLVYNANGTPALFQYAQPSDQEEKPVTNTATNLIGKAQQAEEERRRKAEKAQQDVRQDLITGM